MTGDYKEVYFNQYCHKCIHKDVDEGELPCDECLGTPMNVDSHKPIYFKEAEE